MRVAIFCDPPGIPRSERVATWLSAGLIAVLVVFIWIPWMFSPLTLDETGSQWIISGRPTQIIPRCIVFPQSILYCFLLWGETAVAGSSEFVVRFPSLVASGATLVLLFRLGARAIGPSHRFLLPLLWVFFISPPSLAVEARPYALAMCAGAWTLYAMEGFLSEDARRQLWIFALIAPSAAYFSFLFVLPLAGCGLFLVLLTFWYRKIRVSECLRIFALWAVMLMPLIPQIRASAATAALHTIPNAIRNREDLFLAFLPPAIVLGLMAGFVTTLIRDEPVPDRRPKTGLLFLAVLVAISSIVPLYLVTQLTPAHVWASRYMSLAFVPLALLYAAILGNARNSVESRDSRVTHSTTPFSA